MPIHEFQCPNGHVHEQLVSSDVTEHPCDRCATIAQRIISRPGGFDLKGSGFFRNDYPSKGQAQQ